MTEKLSNETPTVAARPTDAFVAAELTQVARELVLGDLDCDVFAGSIVRPDNNLAASR